MKKIIETVAEGGGELGVHMYPYLSVLGSPVANPETRMWMEVIYFGSDPRKHL